MRRRLGGGERSSVSKYAVNVGRVRYGAELSVGLFIKLTILNRCRLTQFYLGVDRHRSR